MEVITLIQRVIKLETDTVSMFGAGVWVYRTL